MVSAWPEPPNVRFAVPFGGARCGVSGASAPAGIDVSRNATGSRLRLAGNTESPAGCWMRYLYLVTLVLFAGGIAVFSAQNLQIVEVSFLRLNANLRLAFVIVGVYLLGAVTGGSLWALLRQSFKGAGLSASRE